MALGHEARMAKLNWRALRLVLIGLCFSYMGYTARAYAWPRAEAVRERTFVNQLSIDLYDAAKVSFGDVVEIPNTRHKLQQK